MKIKLIDLLEDDSAAAKQAKAKGLKSKGFGNWADSSGKVVAQTKDDKLVMTKKAKDPEEKEKKKSSKKKSDEPKKDSKPKGDEKPKDDKKKSKEKPKDDKKKSKEKPKKKKSSLPPKRDGESAADYKKRIKKIKDGRKRKEKFDKERKQARAEKSEFDKVEVSDGGKPKPSKNNPYGKSDQGSTAVDATGEVPKYESQRKFSKEQHKTESDAKNKTVHSRGNGHFAGKNEKGDVQGFFGKDADVKSYLYSQGEDISDENIKKVRQSREDRQKMKDSGISDGGTGFEADGGGSVWGDMMDGETPSKSWWEDLLNSFEKEAGDIKAGN